MLAAQAIQAGDADVIVAGGMESMSNAPYLLDKARTGYRMGNAEIQDALYRDGLIDVYNNYLMGNAAELCARECAIHARSAGRICHRELHARTGSAEEWCVRERDRSCRDPRDERAKWCR